MNSPDKLSVEIFSDANILALNIFDNLVLQNCFVNIVTEDYRSWKDKISKTLSSNKFSIARRGNLKDAAKFDYIIFCSGFIKNKTAYQEVSKFILSKNPVKAKTLILLPFEISDRDNISKIKINENTAVIFISDLIGPHINLESNLLVSKTVAEIVQKRQMSVGIGEVFYPINVADVVRLIVKWLFSFGPYGKAVSVLGHPTPVDAFWNQNQRLVGKIKLVYDPNISTREVPKDLIVEKINSDLQSSLTEMYSWLKNCQTNISKKVKKAKSIKIQKPVPVVKHRAKVKIPKAVKPLAILLIVLMIFPFVMLLINLLISFISYREFIGDSDESAGNTVLLARTFAVVAEDESRALTYVPGVNIIYKEVAYTAGLIADMDNAAFHAIPIVRSGAVLFDNALGGKLYNPDGPSSNMALGLSLLHDDVVLMNNLTESAVSNNVILASKVLTKIDFDKYIDLTLEGQILANNIPSILGSNGIKTYLILFQNNMELRPTGGFIGSYGLATFDTGRLTDLTINDVYSADGQLNGHVEPPAPIKDYLGEANWWLRDSNWDPDFPTSAERAEWFLNKEVGRSVDGVIGVDLSPIKDLLSETGPVYLPDFGLNITADNLYEKVESEVQDNTFPGTHQKASFLTALSRELLENLVKLSSREKLLVLKGFYDSLDTRHLQVFLHDNSSQNAISSIGWDGSVTLPTCGNGCYSDMVGLVEANVGVNKANFFVQRNVNLDVNVSSYQIDRSLILSLKDTANSALGLAGKYKTYIRLLVPKDAEIENVTESTGQNSTAVSPDITVVKDRKEVGALVEILAGQSAKLTFTWKSNITTTPISGYLLYIRKQAGLDTLPVSLSVSTPSLTNRSPYLYNAILTRDLLTRFSI